MIERKWESKNFMNLVSKIKLKLKKKKQYKKKGGGGGG